MNEIDCRKLSCPEPLLRTKKALEESQNAALRVLVDNAAARDNILRLAQSRGMTALWKEAESGFMVEITRSQRQPGEAASWPETDKLPVPAPQKVILIASDQLGRGSEELGALLMRNFIFTLTRQERLPRAIIFMNSGVRLCAEGSAVLEELTLLQGGQVKILACGACLDYYGLKESLRVGIVSNMYEIAELIGSADVITL